MARIKSTYESPVITEKLNKLKSLGADRIAQEIEKSIFITIKNGGGLFHINRQLDEEIAQIYLASNIKKDIQ